MCALPKKMSEEIQQIDARITQSFPNSKKVYVQGSRPDILVPLREISISPSHKIQGTENNPPIHVYDTSGPYTDPMASIDLMKGLPPLRQKWIEERQDTES
ncbi:MAG: phosphomethylpyrimidine synthase ThiC, partial [Deltaproteobacteria bacterium]|nr:phosphomethylpyrimidine synthase ThiC [Deltaproteobacteria bacterium]